jgi:hypothetical protein
VCYSFFVPKKKSSKKLRSSYDMSTLDGGGGSSGSQGYGLISGLSGNNGMNTITFVGATRPDVRGSYGYGNYDYPDPYKPPVPKRPVRPRAKKPSVRPPKKKKNLGGGGGKADTAE